MDKLIILPAATNSLGGTVVSLSLFFKGVELCEATERVKVLVPSGSFLSEYLQTQCQEKYLQPIDTKTDEEFIQKSLQWLSQQPSSWVLLMENRLSKELMFAYARAAFSLRLSQRPVYYFFHDLALSYNSIGYSIRKSILTILAPSSICNSKFTAEHTKRFIKDIRGILYQPIDSDRFNSLPANSSPPELQAITDSGFKIMLTPSRLDEPGIFNDKNLRTLIPVLAELKAMGYNYHSVIIGEDTSEDGRYTRDLQHAAVRLGVGDRLIILPPTIDIESYYKCADLVVTLAPREPFGRTVVEAIACGIPVVGSNSGGIGEILSHFASEWTTDSEDAIAAAKTIARVAESKDTPALLAKGEAWVKHRCGAAKYAHDLLQITGINLN